MMVPTGESCNPRFAFELGQTYAATRSLPADVEEVRMSTIEQDSIDLELALLRRSLPRIWESSERCGNCRRSLLTGEHVYDYATGVKRCELCREREVAAPLERRTVHGPEFGHSLRLIDRRAA